MKMSAYMSEWLESKKPDFERSTYEAYVVYITKHINPYFDNLGKEIEELRPLDIKGYTTHKRTHGRKDGKEGGLSAVSVRKHLNIIKQALNEAVLLEIIPTNPAAPIRLAKSKSISPNAKFIGTEQVRSIITAMEGHPLHDLVLITAYYGLRRSEALGLKWSAVDFNNNTLHIRHTVVKNITIEAKDRTKTESSRRAFELFPDVKEMLLKRKAAQGGESPYIFTDAEGKLFRPDYVTRGFQRALRRKGLEVIRFHDLRHACATILFDKGMSIADVQQWLGHSDIETTMNIYVAYGRGRKIAVAKQLEGLFS